MNRALLAPAIFMLTTVSLACIGSKDTRTPQSGGIEFTICARDEDWTPPSPEAQAEFLASIPRYRQSSNEPLKEEFREALGQRFFQSLGANSALQDFTRLSGMWAARQFELAEGCRDFGPVAAGTKGDLWLLLYEAQKLTLENNELFLTVALTNSGFEVVQWDNPLAPEVWSPALHILNEEGDEIDFFASAEADPKQPKSGGEHGRQT